MYYIVLSTYCWERPVCKWVMRSNPVLLKSQLCSLIDWPSFLLIIVISSKLYKLVIITFFLDARFAIIKPLEGFQRITYIFNILGLKQIMGFPDSSVKNMPAMQETPV